MIKMAIAAISPHMTPPGEKRRRSFSTLSCSCRLRWFLFF